MPELTTDQLTLGVVVSAGVALLSFLITMVLWLRLRKIRREYAILRGDAQERDLIGAVSHFARKVDTLDQRIDSVATNLQAQSALGRFALQKFHLVRFDAFEDMGGRLSFSAALLDDHGDGVVVTSINGRTETRTYAKPVKGLVSDHNLSDEERAAISGAAAGYERSEASSVERSRSS